MFRFASDGRGLRRREERLIKVFDNLADTTPTVFADLRTKVHAFWDRGPPGLELSPSSRRDPSVFVLYTHDAASAERRHDGARPVPRRTPAQPRPDRTDDGCVVSGRLSRLQAAGMSRPAPRRC